jgi:hypothetical protein
MTAQGKRFGRVLAELPDRSEVVETGHDGNLWPRGGGGDPSDLVRTLSPPHTRREFDPLAGGPVLKPLLTLAAAGFAGFALWKVLSLLFVPFLGTLLGLFLTVVKVVLLVALVVFVLSWLCRDNSKDGEAPAS